MKRDIDLIGKKFNRLTILEKLKNDKYNYKIFLCECECGNIKPIRGVYIINGHTKSCGCLQKEKASEIGKNLKQYNTYDLTGNYGIGYTNKGEEFYFNLEDYELIKDYCWSINAEGYPVTNSLNTGKKKVIKLHRLIMGVNSEKIHIDHINHTRYDNRKDNLRTCTNQQNMWNKNGIKGYHWDKKSKKYVAKIKIEGKEVVLGYYNTKNEARLSYVLMAIQIHGEFASQEVKKDYNEYLLKNKK